jgi:hypothetical protein
MLVATAKSNRGCLREYLSTLVVAGKNGEKLKAHEHPQLIGTRNPALGATISKKPQSVVSGRVKLVAAWCRDTTDPESIQGHLSGTSPGVVLSRAPRAVQRSYYDGNAKPELQLLQIFQRL